MKLKQYLGAMRTPLVAKRDEAQKRIDQIQDVEDEKKELQEVVKIANELIEPLDYQLEVIEEAEKEANEKATAEAKEKAEAAAASNGNKPGGNAPA